MRLCFIICLVIVAGKLFAQSNCEVDYIKIIKESSEIEFAQQYDQIKNAKVKKDNIDARLALLGTCIDKIKGTGASGNFKVVIAYWKNFNVHAEACIASGGDINNEDLNGFNGKLSDFRKILAEYRSLIFPDSLLIRKMDSLRDSVNRVIDTTDSISNNQRVIAKKADYFYDTTGRSLRNIKSDYWEFKKKTDTDFQSAADTARRIYATDLLIKADADSLKYFLFKRDTGIARVLFAGLFADGLYSISFLQVIDRRKNKLSPLLLGAELFLPVDSKGYPNPGGSVSAGLLHRSCIWQAGLIYLDNDRQSQNISWKAGWLYHPFKSPVLIGFSYSPLTSFGCSVGIKL